MCSLLTSLTRRRGTTASTHEHTAAHASGHGGRMSARPGAPPGRLGAGRPGARRAQGRRLPVARGARRAAGMLSCAAGYALSRLFIFVFRGSPRFACRLGLEGHDAPPRVCAFLCISTGRASACLQSGGVVPAVNPDLDCLPLPIQLSLFLSPPGCLARGAQPPSLRSIPHVRCPGAHSATPGAMTI